MCGFTFGERLAGGGQGAIAVEKTDLRTKGLAQFIFSEFCRRNWSDCPLVNVGDAWGLESLAWTKNSYRPAKMLQKYTLRKAAAVAVGGLGVQGSEFRSRGWGPGAVETGQASLGTRRSALPPHAALPPTPRSPSASPTIPKSPARSRWSRRVFQGDVRLSERQLTYLQRRGSAVFLVADRGGQVVGEGIALVRPHKTRGGRHAPPSGRVYSLAVRNDCRGRHVGRRLLLAMLDRLLARGAGRVYLEVASDHARAIGLYEHLGFRWIGYLPDYYGPGRAASHMMCELAQSVGVTV